MKTSDKRYTVTHEYCGQPTIRRVVRFCGEWVGHAGTDFEVNELITTHQIIRERTPEQIT